MLYYDQMNKRLKSLLYLGYKSCSLFFRHFERLVDFIVMRKVNPIKQCNRVVDDYVVRFTIARIEIRILSGLIVFNNIKIISDYDRKSVSAESEFYINAMVKSVEWEIVAANAKLFLDHSWDADENAESRNL